MPQQASVGLVTKLLIAYGCVVIISGVLDVFFFSFQIADCSTTPISYYTDYTGLLKALPFCLVSFGSAFLLTYRFRVGFWFTLITSALGLCFYVIYLWVSGPYLVSTLLVTASNSFGNFTLSLLLPLVTMSMLLILTVSILVLLLRLYRQSATVKLDM